MRGLVFALILSTALTVTIAAPLPFPADRIWFTPGPGTIDMLRLFEAPDEWGPARGGRSTCSSSIKGRR